MRLNKILLYPLLCFVVVSCSEIVKFEEKPLNIERMQAFRIRLVDNSGYMKALYGDNYVRDADIFLKSSLFDFEYRLKSDSTGMVEITGLLSDKYFISAVRQMSPEEMERITGFRITNHKLSNTKVKLIELHSAHKDIIEIPMDLVIGGSSLIISEIYACGPPGSGLYWHDKYMEVYNNSDSVIYLDGIVVAVVYSSSYLGINYVDDPEYVHSKNVWIFPGSGKEFPLYPGDFAVCAGDAIDHRINAPNSVDLSNAEFEFYKDDAPDIDNQDVPNMIKIYQTSGFDWLIGGERDAIVIAKMPLDSLKWFGDEILIHHRYILDGVEYLKDPTRLDQKILNHAIDAGGTGGIQFYTGKSMERIALNIDGRMILKDDNNSSVDFVVINKPTPEYHHSQMKKRK